MFRAYAAQVHSPAARRFSGAHGTPGFTSNGQGLVFLEASEDLAEVLHLGQQ